MPKTKRPRGICPLCGKEVAVNAHGEVHAHNAPKSMFGCRAAYRGYIHDLKRYGPLPAEPLKPFVQIKDSFEDL